MDKITTAIWIALLIFTIIPNVLTLRKFILKKYDSIGDCEFLEWMSLWTFFWVSLIKTGVIVYNWL